MNILQHSSPGTGTTVELYVSKNTVSGVHTVDIHGTQARLGSVYRTGGWFPYRVFQDDMCTATLRSPTFC